MGSIRVRKETGKLFFDFRFQNKRLREQTLVDDTPANRRKLEEMMKRIDAEITLGTFDYQKHFPGSKNAQKFEAAEQAPTNRARVAANENTTPLFEEFAETWFSEMKIQWRTTYIEAVTINLNKHILPVFRDKEVGCIRKADILAFRSELAKVTNQKGKTIAPATINKIMVPLRMILNEAANRFDFSSPYAGIKSLSVPRTDVLPFSIEEVRLILQKVRPDFKNYFLLRFFTGMRTSEINGLTWKNVDFDRMQILVRQAYVAGEFVYTKNDGSFRSIDMSKLVYDALKEQLEVTGKGEMVFCNTVGKPLYHKNVSERVWYPLLRHLGIERRTPYQTRHTAATLWLASGESPEWIARQMGHTTTEMLFRVYSRYVPNLTRKDGSAMERLLLQQFEPAKKTELEVSEND